MPTVLRFNGGPVRTTGFRGDPGKTTMTCAMCRMPNQVNAAHLCRDCAKHEAAAEACTGDLVRWARNEELFHEARELLSRVETLLVDELSARRSPVRVTALRGAEIAMREVITQLHRAGGV